MSIAISTIASDVAVEGAWALDRGKGPTAREEAVYIGGVVKN